MLNIGDFAFDTTTGTNVQMLEKIDVWGYVSYKVFNPATINGSSRISTVGPMSGWVEFAFDAFIEMKDKRIQKNQESYNKYMYALQLRTEAAEHIGIANIRGSRLRKLEQEKANIEEAHKTGSQIYPDFKLAILIRLEA